MADKEAMAPVYRQYKEAEARIQEVTKRIEESSKEEKGLKAPSPHHRILGQSFPLESTMEALKVGSSRFALEKTCSALIDTHHSTAL